MPTPPLLDLVCSIARAHRAVCFLSQSARGASNCPTGRSIRQHFLESIQIVQIDLAQRRGCKSPMRGDTAQRAAGRTVRPEITRPCICPMVSLRPSSACKGTLPSETISCGSIRSISLCSHGRNRPISSRVGVRLLALPLSGDLHRAELDRVGDVKLCTLKLRPLQEFVEVLARLAHKGLPSSASCAPGASPTSITRACGSPSPNT